MFLCGVERTGASKSDCLLTKYQNTLAVMTCPDRGHVFFDPDVYYGGQPHFYRETSPQTEIYGYTNPKKMIIMICTAVS